MKSILLGLTLLSTLAFAETGTFTVEGMHCSSCKKMVTKNVCENETIAKNSESCSVKLTDTDKQLGEITIVSKKDTKIDEAAVKTALKTAGEDYKISKVEIKELAIQDLKTAVTSKGTTTENTETKKEKK